MRNLIFLYLFSVDLSFSLLFNALTFKINLSSYLKQILLRNAYCGGKISNLAPENLV